MILLFFPETRFERKYDVDRSPSPQTPSGEPKEPSSIESQERANTVKKTFLQDLNPWSGVDKNANYFRLLLKPWPMVVYPAAVFGFLTYASGVGWILCATNTNASVFQHPPYNMTPAINGLIGIAGFIGIALGAYCGGGLTDKFAEWRARKNNGVFEPETRLAALVIPFFVVPFGLLM
jgi:hypothetical protein